ncbi:MAG: phosphatase PAP2 family protein [Thermomicrobiales bacterium]
MAERSLLRPGAEDTAPRWPGMDRVPGLIAFIVSQIVVLFLLFQIYKMARKTFIQRAEDVAFDHATDVLHLERRMGLDFELGLQQLVLRQPEWIIHVFNNFYAYYMYVFYACMVIAMIFSVERWRYLRRWFLISMAIATPLYAIYPLAPPRFMQPYGWDFVDTLAVYGPNYFSESGLVTANRYAAMPSMHVGWTTLAAITLAACLPWKRIGMTIAALLIVMISVTVMVTGNHYWLDGVVGWGVIGLAALVNRVLPYPLPIRWPWMRTRSAQGAAGESRPARPVTAP